MEGDGTGAGDGQAFAELAQRLQAVLQTRGESLSLEVCEELVQRHVKYLASDLEIPVSRAVSLVSDSTLENLAEGWFEGRS